MSADLPDGITREDMEDHAVSIQLAGQLINATSAYLTSDAGSPAERAAEDYLDMLAEKIAASPPAAGRIVLVLSSLLVNTADQEQVQAWFTEQSDALREALGE